MLIACSPLYVSNWGGTWRFEIFKLHPRNVEIYRNQQSEWTWKKIVVNKLRSNSGTQQHPGNLQEHKAMLMRKGRKQEISKIVASVAPLLELHIWWPTILRIIIGQKDRWSSSNQFQAAIAGGEGTIRGLNFRVELTKSRCSFSNDLFSDAMAVHHHSTLQTSWQRRPNDRLPGQSKRPAALVSRPQWQQQMLRDPDWRRSSPGARRGLETQKRAIKKLIYAPFSMYSR